MRKNCARKWLHFVLDLLPVILIPVFMIYSHRHTLTERTEVDIQYKYESNEINTLDDLVLGNVYHIDTFEMQPMDVDISDLHFTLRFLNFTYEDFTGDLEIVEEINYARNMDYFKSGFFLDYYYDSGDLWWNFFLTNQDNYVSLYFETDDGYWAISNADFLVYSDLDDFITYCNYFGLEITSSDFNVIESVDVQDTNSDIMSVFMDDFNNAVDKYFNFNSVFNFQDIKDWATDNLFGGTMPPVAQSVYNIIVYEFIMDIIFLMYAVFMFIIDFAEDCLERPFNRIKRG